MFFTKAGRVIAWLAVTLGTLQLCLGLVIASSSDPSSAAQRYLGEAYSGVAIDQAFLVIATGVALGILTEISRAMTPSDR